MVYHKRDRIVPEMRIKAEREEAERLIRWAKENGIPIEEDPLLLQILMSLDLLEEIPDELQNALLEVYEWFYTKDHPEMKGSVISGKDGMAENIL